jgi:D-3-phosphoglycerate dehydrogenase
VWKLKILITPRSFPEAGSKIYGLFNSLGIEVVDNRTGSTFTEERMAELCADADGLLVGIDPVTRKVIDAAAKLKAISKYGAGLDNIDLEAARERGIKVARTADANARSVAELAVGLFFTISRDIVRASTKVKEGEWKRYRQGFEIGGKTLGLIGLGNIGRLVAEMGYGLGMHIIAYDPYIDKDVPFIGQYRIRLASLDEVVSGADILSLHLPLTESTAGMINAERLKSMKKTAILVNTSRGGLVDEDALYEALTSGTILAAAQDVFSVEPPGKHKLLGLDNFVLTPHIGAYTAEANKRMVAGAARNLLDMLEIEFDERELVL